MRPKRHLINSLIAMVFVLFLGAIGFMYYEGLSLFDAFWLTLITVLTVGYGDVIPRTHEGKIFAMYLIPLGVGIVSYTIGALTSMMIEGEFSKSVGRKAMKKKIAQLENHIIICGLGRVGEQVVKQLQSHDFPFVIIEQNEQIITESDSQGLLYLVGDATDDTVLLEAGIKKAAGLVATLPQDANNVFIALTAKGLNPNVQIVARAERPQSEEKLRRAGADKVINPSSIGGTQMVMSLLKPLSVEYMEMLLESSKRKYGVEELLIKESSTLINKTIAENSIRKQYGVTIVALVRKNVLMSNPHPEEIIQLGDVMIVFGTDDQLKQFEKATNTHH